jgi:hypothetical protein
MLSQTDPSSDQAPSSITLPAQTSANSDGSQLPKAPQQPSRLTSTLAAIVSAATTGLSGLPDKGRPTFITGLGEGARAAQAAEANQQQIKFRSFDDQMRAAQLHNQDLALQNATQEQQDAHETHINKMHENDGDWGIKYDTIANHGDAVMDHLTTQTAANGSAVVPPGTHISADGENILIPRDTPETTAGQLAQFKAVAPALGLNVSIPNGATKLDPKVATVFYNKLQGFDPNGDVYTADKLPALIASNQAQRDELAKQGAPQNQLDALDGIVSKQKAQLKADNDQATKLADAASKRKIAEAKATVDERGAQTRETNSDKPQKTPSTVWVQGVSADEKKKAELAENMTFNANNIASTLMRRPDLVGAIAGRYTDVKAMAGSNDPDIVALSTDIHNIAMANNGIHGMRSAEAVTTFENKLLNHFKNGPQGIYGGLKASTDSVQTFIDNARPDTYKTHSKQGGAVRAMVPQAQGQQ